jgi:MFS family permease
MLVTEAIVFATGLGMAITQATLYAYYTTYPLLFSQIYHKDQYSASLAFTPILIGSLVSLPILWTFDHFTYRRTRLSGAVLAAEKRLVPALLGVVLMPISLFWLAFIGTSNIPSLVPQASGLLFGMAYMFNMIPLVMYNNDVYGTRGLAACVFVWFSVSASFPLFMGGLMEGMGFRWAVCVLGFVAVAMIPVPWVLWRLGERLRVRSWYLKGDEGLGSAVVRL